MKIEKLIEVFEKLLPIYEKAYKEEWSRIDLFNNNLCDGFCLAAWQIFTIDLDDVMIGRNCYYKNLLVHRNMWGSKFLFPLPSSYKDLKPRIDFMKSEIKSLKRLQKRGYTHV